jgi:hypothetical protein
MKNTAIIQYIPDKIYDNVMQLPNKVQLIVYTENNITQADTNADKYTLFNAFLKATKKNNNHTTPTTNTINAGNDNVSAPMLIMLLYRII